MELAPPSTRRSPTCAAATTHEGGLQEAAAGARLPVLGRAPEFTGNQRWFNTPGGRPLSLRPSRQVVLVDFWTYTCINCIRTLPYLDAWYGKYRGMGSPLVGVHTPEFPFEKVGLERRAGDRRRGPGHPVAQDNDYATWTAYGNQYWPAKYLIDARGRVRLVHFGEGAYGETERAIRSRSSRRGAPRRPCEGPCRVARIPHVTTPSPIWAPAAPSASRMVRFCPQPGVRSDRPVRAAARPSGLRGGWRISGDSATARPRRAPRWISRRAARLRLGLPGGAASRAVLLDGHPIPTRSPARTSMTPRPWFRRNVCTGSSTCRTRGAIC